MQNRWKTLKRVGNTHLFARPGLFLFSLLETVLDGLDLPEKDCVVRLLDGIWNCDVLSMTKDWRSAMAVLPWILENSLLIDEESIGRKGGDSSPSSAALAPAQCPDLDSQRSVMEAAVNVFLYLLRMQSPETITREDEKIFKWLCVGHPLT